MAVKKGNLTKLKPSLYDNKSSNRGIKYLNKSNGSFIMKTFQNSMLKNLRKKMELSFKIVQTFKPAASKKQSGEIFLYGAYK